MWQDIFDPGHMGGDIFGAEFGGAAFGASGVMGKAQVQRRAKGGLRPDWTRGKATTTCGTDIHQPGLDATRAIGAFIGTDSGIGSRMWQIPVAEFTVWAEFQHQRILSF